MIGELWERSRLLRISSARAMSQEGLDATVKLRRPEAVEETMAKEAVRRRWVVEASPRAVAGLTEGQAVVRGEISRLLGSPVVALHDLLVDAPQQDQLALGQVGTQIGRRPFVLRDRTGEILVRFDKNRRQAPDLFLDYRFYGNDIDGFFIPCAMLGDEVVVAGTVRVARRSNRARREALSSRIQPLRLIIEACAVYDLDSWDLLIRHR